MAKLPIYSDLLEFIVQRIGFAQIMRTAPLSTTDLVLLSQKAAAD